MYIKQHKSFGKLQCIYIVGWMNLKFKYFKRQRNQQLSGKATLGHQTLKIRFLEKNVQVSTQLPTLPNTLVVQISQAPPCGITWAASTC